MTDPELRWLAEHMRQTLEMYPSFRKEMERIMGPLMRYMVKAATEYRDVFFPHEVPVMRRKIRRLARKYHA